ncbi:MAG TPA: beta-propeller domain-containing protein [Nocardioides sp.]|nr:beta-propeller domain-containing protein [Nocardioides sp.]
MTDLERLWDDYPAGKAPVDEIVARAGGRAGTRAGVAAGSPSARRRRVVVRPLLTAAAVTVLAGAFVGGSLVGRDGIGWGGRAGGGGGGLPKQVAFAADLPAAKSCDELLASYVERGLDRVTAWGWDGGPGVIYDKFPTAADSDVAPDGLAAQREARSSGEAAGVTGNVPQTERQVNSETGTNVQEAGVDEPDTVKTDGTILAVVRDDELRVYDVTGSSTEEVSTLDLPDITDAEILLAGHTIVAVGTDDDAKQEGHGTRVLGVSVADPSEPEVTESVAYDTTLLSARQHGSTVRLVLDSGLPDLDFVQPSGRRDERQALKHNREVVRDSTVGDWLPTLTAHGKSRRLLDCTRVAIPDDDLGLDTVSVVGFAAGSPDEVDALGLAGATDIAYESADHLYLAAAPASGAVGPGEVVCADWCDTPRSTERDRGTSYVFDFALHGTSATHVASGEVEGAIRDRWSMDEAGGVLRVALGATMETPNANAIVTLDRQGQHLLERGRIGHLGHGEDIKAVRWFDDLAVVVTFRQVDPLYAVDLTDTAHPRLLGKLEVPGFSAYLHPLGSWRMIGVGEGPGPHGWGAQVGLFNVRDVTHVKRLDVLHYGRGTQALAATDPRAFTWLPDHRTAITVVEKWASRRIGYVSVLRLKDMRFHEHRLAVEYGDDVDLVRAVPVPDGRVVLVTGEKAQFLEL